MGRSVAKRCLSALGRPLSGMESDEPTAVAALLYVLASCILMAFLFGRGCGRREVSDELHWQVEELATRRWQALEADQLAELYDRLHDQVYAELRFRIKHERGLGQADAATAETDARLDAQLRKAKPEHRLSLDLPFSDDLVDFEGLYEQALLGVLEELSEPNR